MSNPTGLEPALESEPSLSLRDILRMTLRRWRMVLWIALPATLAAGLFAGLSPRDYEAEGFIQIIAPQAVEGRVDKDYFEMMIVSHLQKVQSAFLAKQTAARLTQQGAPMTPDELERRIAIKRPAKTDLIRVSSRDRDPERALGIVRLWIAEYLASIEANNSQTALSQVRLLLRKAQSDLLEKQAAADQLRNQVSKTEPLVILARAVDEGELWRALGEGAAPDPDRIRKLADIRLKSQEQSQEHINLMLELLAVDQAVASLAAQRNLYRDAEALLEARLATGSADAPAPAESDAALYVNTLVKNNEVIQFGEPGLVLETNGAVAKIGLFFVAALAAGCLAAFLREWGEGLLSGG